MTRARAKPRSELMGVIHGAASDFHRAGAFDRETMREFDRLCLAPVEPLTPDDIRALREGEKVSQPVFAHYLNVSKSTVSKWERGEKKPDGPSLKLLNLVKRKGLDAIV